MNKFLKLGTLNHPNQHEINAQILGTIEFIDYCKNKKDWTIKEHDILCSILDFEKRQGYYQDKYNQRVSYNGIKVLKKTGTELELTEVHKNEIKKCQDFKYFRKYYCKIQTKNGIKRPDNREYQNELEDVLLSLEDAAVSFSRQSGKTITVGSYLLWRANFHDQRMNIGIVANKPRTAREVLSKIKQMFLQLPIWMMQTVEVWNKSDIELSNTGTRILTDSPSADSFRGDTISLLFCAHEDEIVTIQDKETKEIKEVTFKDLELLIHKTLKNNKYKILTKQGFKDFAGLKKSKHNIAIELFFGDESFKCSYNHLIEINGKFKKAQDLEVGDIINQKTITKISDYKNNDYFYDPVDVEDTSSYISKGMTHHNCDEVAFINKNIFEEMLDSIIPTMSSLTFKQLIYTSTAKGKNHWSKIVEQARANLNDMTIVENDWRDVPHYNKAGDMLEPDVYKKLTIKKYGEKFFRQTEENEFLGSSDTLISGDSLRLMEDYLSKVEYQNRLLHNLKMYREVIKGNSYILSVDSSKDGIDDFSISVSDISKFPFEQVATLDIQIDYIVMPEYLDILGRYYNNALIVIENNEGSGQSITDTLWGVYEYENLYRDKNINGKKGLKKYTGFRTTQKSRPLILKLLKVFIEEGKLLVNSDEVLEQLYTFTSKNGKYQAEDGFKDDAVMALAITFAPFIENKSFDDYELFVRELKKEHSEIKTKEFISTLDLGSMDDGVEQEGMTLEEKKQFIQQNLNDDYSFGHTEGYE